MNAIEEIVWGAQCFWWDSIDKASSTAGRLPCCPHCGGVLYQMDSIAWWNSAQQYEDSGHPGYVKFTEWARGQCFPDKETAFRVYSAHKLSTLAVKVDKKWQVRKLVGGEG